MLSGWGGWRRVIVATFAALWEGPRMASEAEEGRERGSRGKDSKSRAVRSAEPTCSVAGDGGAPRAGRSDELAEEREGFVTQGARVKAAFQSACPDCPAWRRGAFADLVGINKGDCAFVCPTVDARAPVPSRWFDVYGLGLIRRGILIRHRIDDQGRASVVDVVGPGSVFLLGGGRGPSASAGYAATRLLVCLLPHDSIDGLLGTCGAGTVDLVRLQSEALERLERINDARGRPNAAARVAALLCLLVDTLSPHRETDAISTGLQQRDMAAVLGLRHETVCRELRQLEKSGLINRDASYLRITDRAGLEAI